MAVNVRGFADDEMLGNQRGFSGHGPSANANAGPFEPSAPEMLSIEQTIARKLLDPASILLSGLEASQSAAVPALLYVCGRVRGKNAFGGYTQPTPFVGTLRYDASGGPRFDLARIANPDPQSQSEVYKHCADKPKPKSQFAQNPLHVDTQPHQLLTSFLCRVFRALP